MDYKSSFYPETNFGGFSDIDGTIVFYTRVNALLKPSSTVLDIGCSHGTHIDEPAEYKKELRIFKGKCAKVIGIDVDESARVNPFIDEFHLLVDENWPLPDDSIDLAVCDAVIEHIANPDAFFSECRRVIKSGGYLCIRTGNTWGYAAMLARIIPEGLHSATLKKAQNKRKSEDIFPTLYRCNTIWKMRRMLNQYGFDHYTYGYEAEPSYLSFSRFLYWIGVMHQRFSPGLFKLAIFAFAKKKGEAAN
jgi:SAM-dependent methyltransferase